MIAETESPLPRFARRSIRSHLSPTRWAKAQLMYVKGELADYHAVAEWLQVNITTVAKRASEEQWQSLRQANADRIKNMAADTTLDVRVDLESLQKMQAALAERLFALGNYVAKECESLCERIETCRDTREGKSNRLIERRSALMEDLRILAGIPHPDRVQRVKQDNQASSGPSSARPSMPSPVAS